RLEAAHRGKAAEPEGGGDPARHRQPDPGEPEADLDQTSSASPKKNAISFAAFSFESLPWIALRSMSVPKRLRTEPGSALRESVAPIVRRRCATASARSSAATTTGPSVMKRTSAS